MVSPGLVNPRGKKGVSVVGETSDRGETGENGNINLEI